MADTDKKQKAGAGSNSAAKRGQGLWRSLLVPILAGFTGLVFGAIVIIISEAEVVAAFQKFSTSPGTAFKAAWDAVATAYGTLFAGSFGNPVSMFAAIKAYLATGDGTSLLLAFYPLAESLTTATPYILAGLAVAIGFRCGLFNIGAEGQFLIGALGAVFVGYKLVGLPWYVHLPLAMLGGILAGGLWGAIPGYLKARFGAHEVVNTIMMNWIAFRLSDWLLLGPMKAVGYRPVTPNIEAAAELPRFFPDPIRLNWGFILALVIAVLVYWFLFKTTAGFEVRAVGSNPDAARYAGMSVIWNFIFVMFLSGALAGLAGASQVLGVDHWVGTGYSGGIGFDAIALALLGRSHPAGVVLAALFFGFLRSGATNMQSMSGVPIEIIYVIQGVIIIFIAAPDIIRWLYRLRGAKEEKTILTRGWGK